MSIFAFNNNTLFENVWHLNLKHHLDWLQEMALVGHCVMAKHDLSFQQTWVPKHCQT